ncbi:MAG: hypothetical protein HOE69_02350 [Euryarchaeota archaeon]|jgi:hypothetical protein|nr:hypothetical protein [Euryarchaeota archaeon]
MNSNPSTSDNRVVSIDKQATLGLKAKRGQPRSMRGRPETFLFCAIVLLAGFAAISFTSISTLAEGDDCPGIDGDSSQDRVGCPDTDGDGWSDPDDDWGVNNGADAFPNERTQWVDRDGDGYGDTSSFDAVLIDHFPDDEHLHRAVLSVGCNPPDHTLPLGESSFFICTVKNEGLVPIRLSIDWDNGEGISIVQMPNSMDLEEHGFGGDQAEIRLDFTAKIPGITGGNLYFNESADAQSIYSLPLGVLVESSTPTSSSSDNASSLDPFKQKANSLASWMTTTTGYNFTAQTALALIILGPLLLFVIARRTQTAVRQRQEKRTEIEEAPANEDEHEEEVVDTLSIEDMAADPNQPEKKPKRGVKGAEGKVLASGMVEVMVGGIDMPTSPSDAFNVLSENLDDSEIEEENWDSALDDIEDDDNDSKVADKHRIGETETNTEIIETKKPSKTQNKTKTKSQKTEKKNETTSASKKSGKTTKKEVKKRPKGKVGHTRGPGIDLK